ncbi:HAAS signaling domain-containing protein [Streptomyces sp. NPDC007905]|uniref:HAAS signaling domain-containing protein n=1 Tax=Streptomyces sp. NPDC007905 TaxID=3364788 RepID=UPI0036E276B0
MKTTDHPLVTTYLATVAREATGLSPERKSELLADLTEHIAVALAEETTPGDDGIRVVLERLGDPCTIVATAQGEEPPVPPASRWRTIAPLVLLPIAGPMLVVTPLVGGIALIAGTVLLWIAPRWRTRDKAAGMGTTLLAPLCIALAGLTAATGSMHPYAWELTTMVAAALLSAFACAHLYRAARRSS